MIKYAFSLDWIRATFPVSGPVKQDDFALFEGQNMTEARALGSYNVRFESEFHSISWHTEHPSMRVLVEMTGQGLSKFRMFGETDDQIIRWFTEKGARFTRVDFAVDCFDSGFAACWVDDDWGEGIYHTAARSVLLMQGRTQDESKGDTVYLGSKDSTRRIRIYDKGKERGVDRDWLRCEMQWKKERAEQMGYDMSREGVKSAGMAHLRDYVPGSNYYWLEGAFLDDVEIFDIEAMGRPVTNTERWLFETCIPAIAKAAEAGVPGIVEALEAIIWQAGDRGKHGPSIVPHG